jgi:hypothetical protein
MSKSRKKRKTPKHVLALPDLEQAKSAVLNTLTSKSGQRTYDHEITEFVEWYCSEPRLAFGRQHFQRDLTFQSGVLGQVDFTHSTPTEQAEDTVGSKPVPGPKSSSMLSRRRHLF